MSEGPGTKLTLAQAARAVRMKAQQIEERPDGFGADIPDGATHWKLTLQRRTTFQEEMAGIAAVSRRSWTTYWSQGPAYGDKAPEILDVLESLWLDVQGVGDDGWRAARGEQAFADWCGEYGYDTDSRRAEKVYRACVRAARAWGRFWEGVEIVSGDTD